MKIMIKILRLIPSSIYDPPKQFYLVMTYRNCKNDAPLITITPMYVDFELDIHDTTSTQFLRRLRIYIQGSVHGIFPGFSGFLFHRKLAC